MELMVAWVFPRHQRDARRPYALRLQQERSGLPGELKPCNEHPWPCSKKLHAVSPEQNFTRAADFCNSGSEAAAW